MVNVTYDEVILPPGAPVGASNIQAGQMETYSTGDAISSHDHYIEYRFNWGDGSESPWSLSIEVSYSWPTTGVYTVRAQARCRLHTARISPWSAGLTVTVTD